MEETAECLKHSERAENDKRWKTIRRWVENDAVLEDFYRFERPNTVLSQSDHAKLLACACREYARQIIGRIYRLRLVRPFDPQDFLERMDRIEMRWNDPLPPEVDLHRWTGFDLAGGWIRGNDGVRSYIFDCMKREIKRSAVYRKKEIQDEFMNHVCRLLESPNCVIGYMLVCLSEGMNEGKFLVAWMLKTFWLSFLLKKTQCRGTDFIRGDRISP